MNHVPLLSANDKIVRTQITLTENLREMLENYGALRRESLSAYLRRAALLSILMDTNQQSDYQMLANKVVGAVKLTAHPEWRTKRKVAAWTKRIRREWKN